MQSAGSESTWFYELLAWAQDHQKQVIGGGVGILAAIFLVYTYQWNQDRVELAGSTALMDIMLSEGEEPSQPSEFAEVASSFGSTSAGKRAGFLEAAAYYDNAQYAEAREAFDRFRSQESGHPLAPIAALGSATCLDAMEKTAEAVSAYQQVISTYPDEPVAGRAQLSLAAIYESQDKPADALRIYDQLSGGNTFSPAAMQAIGRREKLLSDHPELAPEPTNTTAALVSPGSVSAGTQILPAVEPTTDARSDSDESANEEAANDESAAETEAESAGASEDTPAEPAPEKSDES